MAQIYIDTDHSTHHKLYDAKKVGNHASDAEKAIGVAVKQVIKDDAGFTTVKAKNGYRIRLKVSKFSVANGQTSCTMTGEILRLSPSKKKKGEVSETMLSAGMGAGASVTGTTKGAMLQCVEAIAAKLTADSLPPIKKDAASR